MLRHAAKKMAWHPWSLRKQCCRSGIFIPDPIISIPDPGAKRIRIPSASKNLSNFNPKKSGMFIPGPDLKSRIPDPGVKKAPDPGYPDTKHCKKDFKLSRRSKSYSIKIFQSTAGFSAYWTGCQGCGSGSALIWAAASGSRRAKMAHRKRKKWRVFMFWSAGCSLLRDEGFSCRLCVLYGGLRISK